MHKDYDGAIMNVNDGIGLDFQPYGEGNNAELLDAHDPVEQPYDSLAFDGAGIQHKSPKSTAGICNRTGDLLPSRHLA